MPMLLSNSLLFLILISISIKDVKEGIIPNVLLLFLSILGLLQFKEENAIPFLGLGILAYALYKVYPLLKKQSGLGLGDVKMMAVSGLWLDPLQIPLFLILSGVFGMGMAFLWHKLKRGHRFPLGPALALALGICIVGDQGLSNGENKMTIKFSGPSLPPASGNNPDSIVVFLHGYGANGHDLLSIGKAWAPLLPNTLFVAPHGPDESKINPSGNQWFSLDDWNPDHPLTPAQIARIMVDIQALIPSFSRYLDDLLKTHNLPPEKLALVGFSQGSMFALSVALHYPQCAGVVAYSGAFLEDPTKPNTSRPPVLLIHGQEDRLVSPTYSKMAEERLKALNVPVTLALVPGLDHGIDERGLAVGGAFLRKHLDENAQPDLWEKAKESNN
jgi:phospholipase/carboxylesterase